MLRGGTISVPKSGLLDRSGGQVIILAPMVRGTALGSPAELEQTLTRAGGEGQVIGGITISVVQTGTNQIAASLRYHSHAPIDVTYVRKMAKLITFRETWRTDALWDREPVVSLVALGRHRHWGVLHRQKTLDYLLKVNLV